MLLNKLIKNGIGGNIIKNMCCQPAYHAKLGSYVGEPFFGVGEGRGSIRIILASTASISLCLDKTSCGSCRLGRLHIIVRDRTFSEFL